MLRGFNLVANSPSFLLTVPNPRDRRPLSKRFVGEERLSQATAVMGDQSRCDGDDVTDRSIISLEPDHFRARKIPFEPQDVFNIRATPCVDRLIVVAYAAQIAIRLGKEAEPKILNDVRVLVLVDQDIAEAPPEARENFVMLAEQPQRFEQQIAEIDSIERFQTRLVALIEQLRRGRMRMPRLRPPACAWDRCLDSSIRSMRLASARGGQRLSSRLSACRTCLNSRSWSSESRMVKLGRKPTSSACMRKIFAPIEWKVPSHGMACSDPANVATRSRISRAALLVKVTARISCARARPNEIRCAMRAVKTRVLPTPAPARMRTGPSKQSTARRCSSFKPSRYVHGAPLLFVQAIEIRWIGRPDATRERPAGSSVVPRCRRRGSQQVGCLRRLRHESNHALAGQGAQPEISIPAG